MDRFPFTLEGLADSDGRERVAAMLEALERDTVTFFGADVTNQSLVPVSR